MSFSGRFWFRSSPSSVPYSIQIPVFAQSTEISYAYDALGRLTGVAYGQDISQSYTYDLGGNRISVQGSSIDFRYAANGALSFSNGVTIDRTPGGSLKTLTLAPGKSIRYEYDSRSLLLAVSDWLGGTIQFTYDKVGRVVAITRPNNVKATMAYDSDGNVKSWSESGAKIQVSNTLVRNKNGQIISASRSGVLVPTADQLAPLIGNYSYDVAFQITGFSYDELGRRTQDATRNYAWDLASRLKSFSEAGKTIQFDYDSLGLMISQSSEAGARQYVWNHATRLPSLAVIRQDGVDRRYFIYTPAGELLYSVDAGTGARAFYHFDELGNTVLLTNDAGDVTDRYAYAPDGSLVSATRPTDNPFTFAGRYGALRLGSANLYAMRTRIYDSATASFLSKDPVFRLDPRQLNPYQYAVGNPLAFLNVTGEGLMSVEGNQVPELLAEESQEQRIGGFSVGRLDDPLQTYDEMVNRGEIFSHQNIDREYRSLSRLQLFKKANAAGSLLRETDLVGESVAQIRSRLMKSHLYVGDRQALEEAPSGAQQVLQSYSAAALEAQRLFKDRKITDLQKQSLLFQARMSFEDILFLTEGPEDAPLLLNLHLHPKESLLPLILDNHR